MITRQDLKDHPGYQGPWKEAPFTGEETEAQSMLVSGEGLAGTDTLTVRAPKQIQVTPLDPVSG